MSEETRIRPKFPSRCWRCHTWVRPGDGPLSGFITKKDGDLKWTGEHDNCPETDGWCDAPFSDEDYPIFHD